VRDKNAFVDPTDDYLDYDPKQTVLTLHFTLPFKALGESQGAANRNLRSGIFHDFGFADKDPVRLVAAPAQCKFAIAKPSDGFFPKTMRLNRAFSFATSEANIGWARASPTKFLFRSLSG
jgi:hypothetical protein